MTAPLDRAPLLALRNVGLSYPGVPNLFRDFSLELRAGECLGVIGPGGEGKTTLLKMMAGLVAPDRGECLFDGVRLAGLGRGRGARYRRRIGMTFQKSGLFDSLTAFENLDFPLRTLTRLRPGERAEKIAEALRDVGLAGQGGLEIHEMSGGMQKRLGIARALLLEPELVLYDDPTAGLDPVTSRAILNLIAAMKERRNMTVVMVTSDPQLAYPLADHIGFLYRGRFAELAPPDRFRRSESPLVRQFIEGRTEGPLSEPEPGEAEA